MAYADYTFYTDVYLGTAIPEESFAVCAMRASDYLDYITLGKAKRCAGLTELSKACCALAEEYMTIEKARSDTETEIQSESVGAWSRSYRSKAEILANSEKSLLSTARRYLAGTNLLYRGGRV